MFVLKSVDVQQMSKDLATRFSQMMSVPGERPISRTRLTHLHREIDAGNLTTFRWATAEIKGRLGMYRINGQHTSNIFSGGRPPVGTVVLENYICDSLDDVVSLWSRYDATFSSRTKGDVINTAFQSDEHLSLLPKDKARKAANAAAIVEIGPGFTNKASHFEKAQAAIKNKDFIIWACNTFSEKKNCTRVGVLVAALKTFRDSADMATIFWREVQDGSNPDPKSGSRALQRILIEYSGDRGLGVRGSKVLSWEQAAELSIRAWNNWMSGRKSKSLSLSKIGLEKFISLPRGEYSKKHHQILEV